MSESASVEVLSAEVRVLHVGNGQITRSMYRQLDETPVEAHAVPGLADHRPALRCSSYSDAVMAALLIG